MATLLVTGCNRGIGLTLTGTAAAGGHHVIATCREPGQAGELISLAQRYPGHIEILPLEVVSPPSIAALKVALERRPIDVLINNAGTIGPARQSSLDTDFDGFAHTLAVNTLAPLHLAQTFLPNLQAASHGKIITITSSMGSMSYAKSDRIAYRASKAAVNKVMQGLATDLKPLGIAVLLLHPGWVRTDMGGKGADISPDESANGILARMDALTLATSGKFLDYSGRVQPW